MILRAFEKVIAQDFNYIWKFYDAHSNHHLSLFTWEIKYFITKEYITSNFYGAAD